VTEAWEKVEKFREKTAKESSGLSVVMKRMGEGMKGENRGFWLCRSSPATKKGEGRGDTESNKAGVPFPEKEWKNRYRGDEAERRAGVRSVGRLQQSKNNREGPNERV